MKVAIALIAWLVLGGIAATLVPALGTGFFSSPFFLAPGPRVLRQPGRVLGAAGSSASCAARAGTVTDPTCCTSG